MKYMTNHDLTWGEEVTGSRLGDRLVVQHMTYGNQEVQWSPHFFYALPHSGRRGQLLFLGCMTPGMVTYLWLGTEEASQRGNPDPHQRIDSSDEM